MQKINKNKLNKITSYLPDSRILSYPRVLIIKVYDKYYVLKGGKATEDDLVTVISKGDFKCRKQADMTVNHLKGQVVLYNMEHHI